MTGDCHVRFCGSPGVKFPRATRLREPAVAHYAFIQDLDLDMDAEEAYPVVFMCTMLDVSTSGYYEWQKVHCR